MEQQIITIDGKICELSDTKSWKDTVIGPFLTEWTDSNDYVMGHTSGSTGAPKPLKLNKQSMIASATNTNTYFGLKAGDKILLCLNTDYIAGKMIVIRALVGGLNIITSPVCSAPNWKGEVEFAAMVPMQVHTLLGTKEGRERLCRIKTLIIGGSQFAQPDREAIKKISTPPHCYVTYGMTETLSHIAVADVMCEDVNPLYRVLPGVSISSDDRKCLVINVPYIQKEPLITNDIVEIEEDGAFVWQGRWDNVINSGGIKLFPESIEKKIGHLISQRFYMTAEPDEKLGQKLVLKIEDKQRSESETEALKEEIKRVVNAYENPKKIIYLEKFRETSSGKIKRD